MTHIIILLKRAGSECVTLTTKCFASAVAQDHVLFVWGVLVDSDE